MPTEEKYASSTTKKLVSVIDAFLKKNATVTEEHFGWMTIRDTKLVSRLRGGGDITTRKLDIILRFLAKPTYIKGRVYDKAEEGKV
jgi:hypothetical protein